jgi:hypothetical protein
VKPEQAVRAAAWLVRETGIKQVQNKKAAEAA